MAGGGGGGRVCTQITSDIWHWRTAFGGGKEVRRERGEREVRASPRAGGGRRRRHRRRKVMAPRPLCPSSLQRLALSPGRVCPELANFFRSYSSPNRAFLSPTFQEASELLPSASLVPLVSLRVRCRLRLGNCSHSAIIVASLICTLPVRMQSS